MACVTSALCLLPLSSLMQDHWKPHDEMVGGNGILESLDVFELPLTCLDETLDE